MSEHFPFRLAKRLRVLFRTWFAANLCPVWTNINETIATTPSSSPTTTTSRNNSDLRDILRETVSSCQYAIPLSATLSKTKAQKQCPRYNKLLLTVHSYLLEFPLSLLINNTKNEVYELLVLTVIVISVITVNDI